MQNGRLENPSCTFGQTLVDFSGSSWSCVKIRGSAIDASATEPAIMFRRKKLTSRLMAEFSQHEQSAVPGRGGYWDAEAESDAASVPNFPGGLCAAKEAMKPLVADSVETESVTSGPEEPMKDVFTQFLPASS